MEFPAPCAECTAKWDKMISEKPRDFVGRFEAWCSHSKTAVVLRIQSGEVTHWTLASCPTENAFLMQRAYLLGGEAGMRASLEAELAIEHAAAGGGAH